jgi:hypothetical protein
MCKWFERINEPVEGLVNTDQNFEILEFVAIMHVLSCK